MCAPLSHHEIRRTFTCNGWICMDMWGKLINTPVKSLIKSCKINECVQLKCLKTCKPSNYITKTHNKSNKLTGNQPKNHFKTPNRPNTQQKTSRTHQKTSNDPRPSPGHPVPSGAVWCRPVPSGAVARRARRCTSSARVCTARAWPSSFEALGPPWRAPSRLGIQWGGRSWNVMECSYGICVRNFNSLQSGTSSRHHFLAR